MAEKQAVGAISSFTIWLFGWLFTIGFAHLAGWTIFYAVFIWPYYLGLAVAGPQGAPP